jgi:hypothetical protein
MHRLTVFILAGFVAALLAGSPGTASARLDLCQAGIQKEAGKWVKFVELRMSKCLDFVRKEVDFKALTGKDNLPKAASLCEKQLSLLTGFGAGQAAAGKDAFSKLQAGLDKLVPTKCEPGDIEALGHLVGGQNAPPLPGAEIDWVRLKIKVDKLFLAWWDILEQNPEADELLQAVISNTEDPFDDNFGLVDCGSSSGDPDDFGANTVSGHNNLCAWNKDNADGRNRNWYGTGALRNACALHECELLCTPGNPPAGSFANVRIAAPGAEPTDGIDTVFPPVCGSLLYKFCKVDRVPRVKDEVGGDFRLLGGGPGKTVNRMRIDSNRQLCNRGLFTEGWCDCEGGGASPVNITDCRDHSTSLSGGSCSGTVTEKTESCFCSTTGNPCGGLNEPDCNPKLSEPCSSGADCSAGECKAAGDGGRCHPGTVQERSIGFLPPSEEGDCIIQSWSSVTIITDNGDGTCNCPGDGDDGDDCALDADCGCNVCLPFIGNDGVACTSDDTVPAADTQPTVLTTGLAEAIVEDAVYAHGACSGGDSAGAPCMEDANCPPAGNTCVGGSIDRVHNPVPVGGTPLSCTDYETSDLRTWVLVQAVPFSDQPALGDSTATSQFICN